MRKSEGIEQVSEKRKRGRKPKTEEEKAATKAEKLKREENQKKQNIADSIALGLPQNQKIRKCDLTAEKIVEIADKISKRYLDPATNGGSNPDLEKILTNKEKIRTTLAQSLYWYNMAPCKTEEDVAERLNMFFSRIMETGEVPTMERLALALGTTTDTVLSWIDGRRQANPAIIAMVTKARQMLADMESACAATGDMPQVIYIFRSKNYYGMRDVVEQVVHKPDDSEELTEEQIVSKYGQLVQPITEETDE